MKNSKRIIFYGTLDTKIKKAMNLIYFGSNRNSLRSSYHSQGIGLDQRGLRELSVRGVVGVHPLPGQGLQDGPMVEVVVVGVRIDVAEGHAVDLGVGQAPRYLRLQVLLILKQMRKVGFIKGDRKKNRLDGG